MLLKNIHEYSLQDCREALFELNELMRLGVIHVSISSGWSYTDVHTVLAINLVISRMRQILSTCKPVELNPSLRILSIHRVQACQN